MNPMQASAEPAKQAHESDLDSTRAAILKSYIRLLVWTTTVGLVLIPLFSPEIPLLIYAFAFTPCYLLFACSTALLKRGRAPAATWTLVMGMLGLQILANLFNPGLHVNRPFEPFNQRLDPCQTQSMATLLGMCREKWFVNLFLNRG